jgi:UDP-N-acetyl-2-amino-2-deoxyglucuronate dehydrogenase
LPCRMNVYLAFMDKKVRFAIIGCGKIAPRHAEQAVRLGELVAVCDIVKEKADALAGAFNTQPYYSIENLIENKKEIDIVAICTPNGLHSVHSISMMRAGANVLCEKPLCITSSEAASMIRVSEQTAKKLFVVKSTRYNPALIALKKIIEEQKLGNLYSFQLNCFWNRPASYYSETWKGRLDMDGGTLYTQFSHYVDALLWLLGEIKSVNGIRRNVAHQSLIEFEDTGVTTIETKSGIIGGLNWSVNAYKKNMEVSLTIIAEKGSIRIGGEYLNKLEYQVAEEILPEDPGPGGPNDYGSYKGSMSNHDKVYENLLAAMKDDSHPFSNATDGLKTVETIEKIYNCVSLS